MHITIEALRALGAFADELATPGLEFGAWEGGDRSADGSISMPYVTYGERADAFRRVAAGGGFVTPLADWTNWSRTPEWLAFRADPSLIATATPEQLAKLLTTFIRGDRFNEGAFLGAFESGHLLAIARRARALAEAGEGSPA